jgi:mono/diheme cytochrome c family protein
MIRNPRIRYIGFLLLLAGLWVALVGVALSQGQQPNHQPPNQASGEGQLSAGPSGKALFESNCDVCHGTQGQGVIGPALAGDSNLQDTKYVIARILLGTGKRPSPVGGGGGMPAFGARLSAAQVAAVASYIRSSWGNALSPVSVAEVRQQWWGETVNGGELFANVCSKCHGENGGGGIGPSFINNQNLTQTSYVISQILHGGGGMPAFSLLHSNEQMAAVASYIRSNWGNQFGEITVSQINKQRQAGQSGGGRPSAPGQGKTMGPGQLSTQESPLFENNCAVCHGNQGQGGVAPALAGNKNLANANYVISRIVMGGGGMFSFNSKLSSEQIAKVASYIRTSWGNNFGAVTLAQVKQKHSNSSAASSPSPGGVSGGASLGARSSGGAGAQIFVQQGCAACHGVSGEGGIGPKLAGDTRLENTTYVVTRILGGGGPMPAFAAKLSASQIAKVATYIRTSWGNTFGKVTEAQVENPGGSSSSGESGGDQSGGSAQQ